MTPSVQIAGGRRVTRWTREAIIEKMLEWRERHGEAPCSADWNPSLARWRAQEWRIERYRDGQWPSTNAVKRAFGGSFDAAVRAAGLTPARPGPRRAAGAARPPVEPRPPRAPRDVDEELLAAAARVRRAETRAEALRARIDAVVARAEAAEAKARAARRAAAEAEARARRGRRPDARRARPGRRRDPRRRDAARAGPAREVDGAGARRAGRPRRRAAAPRHGACVGRPRRPRPGARRRRGAALAWRDRS